MLSALDTQWGEAEGKKWEHERGIRAGRKGREGRDIHTGQAGPNIMGMSRVHRIGGGTKSTVQRILGSSADMKQRAHRWKLGRV